MMRRWAAWGLVLLVIAVMSAIRLADRKDRVPRSHDNVTVRATAAGPAVDGGRQ